MPINSTASSIPVAFAAAARYLFHHPSDTVVVFLNPDTDFVHIIDTTTMQTDNDIPLLRPERIRFVGAYSELVAIYIAINSAANLIAGEM